MNIQVDHRDAPNELFQLGSSVSLEHLMSFTKQFPEPDQEGLHLGSSVPRKSFNCNLLEQRLFILEFDESLTLVVWFDFDKEFLARSRIDELVCLEDMFSVGIPGPKINKSLLVHR